MSIRITSTVFKSKVAQPGKWQASTCAWDPAAEPSKRFVLGAGGTADTFTEAIELADRHRRELDTELMSDVHADRAGRRAPHTMEATA